MIGVVYTLVSGILVAGYAVASLLFLRFWKRTRDRLFAYFSAAFLILAVQRVASVLALQWTENSTWVYLLRLGGYVLILLAIVEKNRAR
jgi:hypothetical protein